MESQEVREWIEALASEMRREAAETRAQVLAAEERMRAQFTAAEERTQAQFAAAEERTQAQFAAAEERTQAQFTEAEERTRAQFAGLEERTRNYVDQSASETRRHFDVVAEDLRKEIRVVAEYVGAVDEKVDRKTNELRVEMAEGFSEVKGMIRLSYAELDRRLRSLEDVVQSLQSRVERLEAA